MKAPDLTDRTPMTEHTRQIVLHFATRSASHWFQTQAKQERERFTAPGLEQDTGELLARAWENAEAAFKAALAQPREEPTRKKKKKGRKR